jgi:acylphosphatase
LPCWEKRRNTGVEGFVRGRDMGDIRKHLVIEGRVQGVFFRDSARRQARAVGVAGWIRNRPDMSVEAVVEGPEDLVERFVAWCRRGPSAARVDRVKETAMPWTGEFDDFDVTY